MTEYCHSSGEPAQKAKRLDALRPRPRRFLARRHSQMNWSCCLTTACLRPFVDVFGAHVSPVRINFMHVQKKHDSRCAQRTNYLCVAYELAHRQPSLAALKPTVAKLGKYTQLCASSPSPGIPHSAGVFASIETQIQRGKVSLSYWTSTTPAFLGDCRYTTILFFA